MAEHPNFVRNINLYIQNTPQTLSRISSKTFPLRHIIKITVEKQR